MIEELNDETKEIKAKYEKQGYKVAQVKIDDETKIVWAVKKRPIVRVTDLTYENIRHISAAKLIEVLDRNFGGTPIEYDESPITILPRLAFDIDFMTD